MLIAKKFFELNIVKYPTAKHKITERTLLYWFYIILKPFNLQLYSTFRVHDSNYKTKAECEIAGQKVLNKKLKQMETFLREIK